MQNNIGRRNRVNINRKYEGKQHRGVQNQRRKIIGNILPTQARKKALAGVNPKTKIAIGIVPLNSLIGVIAKRIVLISGHIYFFF